MALLGRGDLLVRRLKTSRREGRSRRRRQERRSRRTVSPARGSTAGHERADADERSLPRAGARLSTGEQRDLAQRHDGVDDAEERQRHRAALKLWLVEPQDHQAKRRGDQVQRQASQLAARAEVVSPRQHPEVTVPVVTGGRINSVDQRERASTERGGDSERASGRARASGDHAGQRLVRIPAACRTRASR